MQSATILSRRILHAAVAALTLATALSPLTNWSVAAGVTSVTAASSPLPCTNWTSEFSPPKTIRVLRTRTGVVEVIDFRTYVYRTHVAEFWSEYLDQPYTDALLGAGAVAIRQNAWGWTMTARNWWGLTSYTATQAQWVRDDYADDNQLNGSAGNAAWSRQRRASENDAIALDMRIRLGADLQDDGVGGLEWDEQTSTWTAPIAVLDGNGDAEAPTGNSERSCFDVTDHPSMNQFYRRGTIFEPGYVSGGTNNARYNAAVDSTWGITMQRYYPDDNDWSFWRPGFYGSFTVTKSCLDRPEPGDRSVQMRHPSQPSHYRGWSFFPVNADDCVRSEGLTVEALLRQIFFSWDAELVAGGGTSSIADDRYDIASITPIRLLTPGGDLTGDGGGDLLAFSPAGSIRILSADSSVSVLGQLNGRSAGSIKLADGEELLARTVGRTAEDGAAAVSDLRLTSQGSVNLIETLFIGGMVDEQVKRLDAYEGFDTSAEFGLLTADTATDGIEELFISERIQESVPVAGEPESDRTHLRLYQLPSEGGGPQLIGELSMVGRDARFLLGDLNGDAALDALAIWRSVDGSLAAAVALGSGQPPLTEWQLGEFSESGALLWPVAKGWQALLAELEGDSDTELIVRNTDPSGRVRLHLLNLTTNGAGGAATVDREYVPQVKPVELTKVRAGERNLALIAARAKVSLSTLLALNAGPTYKVTIQPNDTYTKIAARLSVNEGCLRSLNGDKLLIRGKRLIAPYDACSYTAKSVMFRKAPVRISVGEFDWLRAGDGWAQVASRAAQVGLEVSAAELQALNQGTDPSTASVGTKVRIRQAWAPLVRSLNPAPGLSGANGLLSWGNPGEAFVLGAGVAAPAILARDWDGNGTENLVLVAPPTSSGITFEIGTLGGGGRLIFAPRLTRTVVTTGWTLR